MSKVNLNIFGSKKEKTNYSLFIGIANEIWKNKYELNLIFTNSKHIRELNKAYRSIDKETDILSFPFSEKSGEIYICKKIAKIEAKKFDRTIDNFIPFLFIHGCIHLKGYDHSCTMESIEKRVRARFNI